MSSHTDLYFKLLDSFSNKEISMDSVDLQILALIEQDRSAREIAKELKISGALLKKKLSTLHRLKIIRIVENKTEFMGNDFADAVRDKLVMLAGPLGGMLFEDVLDEMGIDEESIPKTIVKFVIERIAELIPDKEQGKKFSMEFAEHVSRRN
jgi:DNA-binding CsgD family transcriptional regulator